MSILKSVMGISFLFVCSQAFAYADKTYECENAEGLPKNSYKFQTVILAPGLSVPYVEVIRHFRATAGDENSPVQQSRIHGFGTVSSTGSNKQMISLAAFRFEFDGDTLLSCR